MEETSVGELPSYTPEEEKLIIRNKRGIPVGVKPRNEWTPRKVALWIVITALGVLGWTMLAVVRGEEVNTIWFVVTALCTYTIAYRFYALYVQRRIMRPDDSNATPAERINNGKDFDPTNRVVLYGHHFAAIAGAGPLVGPVLAAQMGYLPSTLWIILGVCVAGAIQDMLVLFFSMRRGGRSLGQMATDEIGKIGGTVATVIVLVMLMIVLAVLAMVCVNALAASPWGVFSVGCTIPIAIFMGIWLRYVQPGKITQVSVVGCTMLIIVIIAGRWVAESDFGKEYLHLSQTTLVWAMIVYGFFAAVLPVWVLLTPRDYLSTFMKIGTIVVLALGIVVVRPLVEMPAVTEFASNTKGPVFAGTLFPFLFITVACGALSGMHAMVSSGTTPKMVQKESQVRMIGYGGMLMESFVAIMALAAAASLNQGIYFGMNTPEASVDQLAGTSVTQSTKDREVITSQAVRNLGVTTTKGEKIEPRWESWDKQGKEKTFEGAEALKQVADDVGEPSVVSRTGGHPRGALPALRRLRQRHAEVQGPLVADGGAPVHRRDRRRLGIVAAHGRHRSPGRHQDPLSALRHRQPVDSRGRPAGGHRDGGPQGAHEVGVDPVHPPGLRRRRDVHGLVAEDLLHRREHRVLGAVAPGSRKAAHAHRPGEDRRTERRHPQRVHPRHALDRVPRGGRLRDRLRDPEGRQDLAHGRDHDVGGSVPRVELLRTRKALRLQARQEAGRRVRRGRRPRADTRGEEGPRCPVNPPSSAESSARFGSGSLHSAPSGGTSRVNRPTRSTSSAIGGSTPATPR